MGVRSEATLSTVRRFTWSEKTPFRWGGGGGWRKKYKTKFNYAKVSLATQRVNRGSFENCEKNKINVPVLPHGARHRAPWPTYGSAYGRATCRLCTWSPAVPGPRFDRSKWYRTHAVEIVTEGGGAEQCAVQYSRHDDRQKRAYTLLKRFAWNTCPFTWYSFLHRRAPRR